MSARHAFEGIWFFVGECSGGDGGLVGRGGGEGCADPPETPNRGFR